jgi:hypothetical protein
MKNTPFPLARLAPLVPVANYFKSLKWMGSAEKLSKATSLSTECRV